MQDEGDCIILIIMREGAAFGRPLPHGYENDAVALVVHFSLALVVISHRAGGVLHPPCLRAYGEFPRISIPTGGPSPDARAGLTRKKQGATRGGGRYERVRGFEWVSTLSGAQPWGLPPLKAPGRLRGTPPSKAPGKLGGMGPPTLGIFFSCSRVMPVFPVLRVPV